MDLKRGECIRIGEHIILKILSVGKKRIRLGVEAPKGMYIDKREVLEACLKLAQTPFVSWVSS